MEDIDQSNAVLFIHYDPDTKMIYLYGKVRLLHMVHWKSFSLVQNTLSLLEIEQVQVGLLNLMFELWLKNQKDFCTIP